jgi:hypothetical protein
MTDDEEFWSKAFHSCALLAGFQAASEGRIGDSRYVQRLAYEMYERGDFRERATTRPLTSALESVNAGAFDNSIEPRDATQAEGPTRVSRRGNTRCPGEKPRQPEGCESTITGEAADG